MAGTKRPAREIAKTRLNAALKHLRKVRGAAAQLDESERREIVGAVQRELVALDAVFRAPQDEFEFGKGRVGEVGVGSVSASGSM